MSTALTLAYDCRCGSTTALLPERPNAASLVKCGSCGREHGSLADLRDEMRQLARKRTNERAQQIYNAFRARPAAAPGQPARVPART